jgi:hypothetical protein
MSIVRSSGKDDNQNGKVISVPEVSALGDRVDPLGESDDSVSSAGALRDEQGDDTLEGEEIDDFDLSEFPAPLENPDDYLLAHGVEEEVAEEEDGDDFEEEDDLVDPLSLPAWDVVFTPGEEPRLVVRAALLGDGDESDEVSMVESSVLLTEDDVDRLFKLAGKVERYHSRKSKWSRRVMAWAMRRKFFAGATAFILLFLTVITIVNIFR